MAKIFFGEIFLIWGRRFLKQFLPIQYGFFFIKQTFFFSKKKTKFSWKCHQNFWLVLKTGLVYLCSSYLNSFLGGKNTFIDLDFPFLFLFQNERGSFPSAQHKIVYNFQHTKKQYKILVTSAAWNSDCKLKIEVSFFIWKRAKHKIREQKGVRARVYFSMQITSNGGVWLFLYEWGE